MFYSILVSTLFVFLYSFVFFATSDSPLKYSSVYASIEVLSLIAFMSVAFSLVALCLVRVFGLAFRNNDRRVQRIEKFAVFTILFLGISLIAENWSYSVFSYGLKTTDSWFSKLLFISASSFLAVQFHSFFVWTGRKVERYRYVVWAALLFVTLPFLVASIDRKMDSFSTVGVSQDLENELNVLVLISDGVSASEMSVYGAENETTPFLKSIESEFMLFENAFTNNKNSTGSVVSLLTGMSPLTTKVVYPPDLLSDKYAKNNLPRLLGELGYYRSLWGVPHYVDADSQNLRGAFDVNINRTAKGIEQIVKNRPVIQRVTEWLDLSSLPAWYIRSTFNDYLGVLADMFFVRELDNPFAQVAESQNNSANKRHAINDFVRVTNVLEDISETSEIGIPLFSIMHLMKTHGSKFNPNNRVFSKGMVETEPWMLEFYRDAILDFDNAIKIIFEKLEQENMLEKTVVVITSDHGMRWSNRKRIPLMIRLPNRRLAGRYNVNVQLLDLAPTILDSIGLTKPKWMQGESLLDVKRVAKDRFIISAGVSGNRLSNGVWVRKESDRSDFFTANRFAAIQCDSFFDYSYPSKAKKLVLHDRYLNSDCMKEGAFDDTGRAIEIIESTIGNFR